MAVLFMIHHYEQYISKRSFSYCWQKLLDNQKKSLVSCIFDLHNLLRPVCWRILGLSQPAPSGMSCSYLFEFNRKILCNHGRTSSYYWTLHLVVYPNELLFVFPHIISIFTLGILSFINSVHNSAQAATFGRISRQLQNFYPLSQPHNSLPEAA